MVMFSRLIDNLRNHLRKIAVGSIVGGIIVGYLALPPIVGLRITPSRSGGVPFTVNFENQSENGSGYHWDFGDGTISEESNPEHTYSQPGTYEGKLIVYNLMGWALRGLGPINLLPLTAEETFQIVVHEATTCCQDDGIEYIRIPLGEYKVRDIPIQIFADVLFNQYEIPNEAFAVFLNSLASDEIGSIGEYYSAGSMGKIYDEVGNWRVEAGYERYPVTGVTQLGADRFCALQGGRLPTIDEWMVATYWDPTTRTSTKYPWGDSPEPTDLYTNLGTNKLQPVDTFSDGASHFGIYHLIGNVAEWIWRNDIPQDTFIGGSWRDTGLSWNVPHTEPKGYTSDDIGFRCVLTSG